MISKLSWDRMKALSDDVIIATDCVSNAMRMTKCFHQKDAFISENWLSYTM
jgi:hypothetical protein